MSVATIFPTHYSGSISAPASKSAVQRAMALALLHNGETHIRFAGNSDDEQVARKVIQQLGAVIIKKNGLEIISSTGQIKSAEIIHFWESGLSFRMFAPIAALSSGKITLEGSGSLLRRPMNFFCDVLPQLNVVVHSNNGFPPLCIEGPLLAKSISIEGSSSSQFLTGLLFAFARQATARIEIKVNNLKSIPYIDLSLQMLNLFGYSVKHEKYQKFIIDPGNHANGIVVYDAEGDWSGASFFLVAGAIGSEVSVLNLQKNSMQADKRIIEVLQKAGANIYWDNNLVVCSPNKLNAFEFDATNCPDLFPPLAALAANCDGESLITGCSRLQTKESNRVEAIIDVLTKMGVKAFVENDTIRIIGGKIFEAMVSSHNDHRMVMMASALALRATGPVEIEGADAVSKSYPGFFNDLQAIGVKLKFHE